MMTHFQYRAEFQRRVREFQERFATEYTAYDELLDAMAAVEHEMNHIGGGNWNHGDYNQFLETVREHLTVDTEFTPAEIAKIEWSLREIEACGEELKRDGLSRRALDEPIDYLIARVVDWCRRHE